MLRQISTTFLFWDLKDNDYSKVKIKLEVAKRILIKTYHNFTFRLGMPIRLTDTRRTNHQTPIQYPWIKFDSLITKGRCRIYQPHEQIISSSRSSTFDQDLRSHACCSRPHYLMQPTSTPCMQCIAQPSLHTIHYNPCPLQNHTAHFKAHQAHEPNP